MKYSIELHPEAVKDLEDSCNWYEARSEGLGVRLLNSVNNKLIEIAQNPEIHRKRKGNYREAIVDDFPYVLIYEILKRKQVIFVSWIYFIPREIRCQNTSGDWPQKQFSNYVSHRFFSLCFLQIEA